MAWTTPRLDVRGPFRLLRRSPDLRLLLGAGLVSVTGDWVLGIGLTYAVYALTGSTLASAAALLAGFLPQVVVGSVAGVFVDRWDRKRTMIVANLLLSVGLLPLLLVDGGDRIWLVYVVLGFEAVGEVFFAPAEQAMLPRVVPDEDLMAANGLNSQVQNTCRLVGGGLGGVVAAVGGITAITLVDVASFLVAALLLSRISVSGRPESPSPDEDGPEVVRGRLAHLAEEWRVGLRTTWSSQVLRVLVAVMLITSTGEGIMGSLFAPFVRHVLHGGAPIFGLISGIQAVGGVVGGFVVATVAGRWSAVRMLAFGAVVFGLVDLAIFLYPLLWVTPWPAVAGMTLVGVPGAVVVSGLMTLFQRHTTDDRRGRVFSLVFMARSVTLTVGALIAGFLGGSIGIVPILALQGVGYVVAGVVVVLVLDRSADRAPETASLH